MTQPFLYLRHRSSAHSQMAVFKDIDRQLVQIGEDFGAGESLVPVGGWLPATNRVIHWQNDLYCVGNFAIWKYDVQNSGLWDVFYEYAAPAGNSAQLGGLTACSIDGVPVLVTMYGTGSSTGRFVSISTSDIVTESSDKAFKGATWNGAVSYVPVWSPISWRNNLLFMTKIDDRAIHIYDLKSEALQFTSSVEFNVTNLIVFNDKVFFAGGSEADGNRMRLRRLDGNIITDLGNIDNAQPTHRTNGTDNDNQCLIAVTGSLYCAWGMLDPINNPDATAAQIFIDPTDNTIASTIGRTNTVPAELRFGGGLASTATKIIGRIDNISNNGLSPPTYEFEVVQTNGDQAQQRRLYTWNGDMNTTWTFIDVGLNDFRHDYNTQVAGSTVERIWSGSGTLNASEPTLVLSGPNILATFKVWGSNQTQVKAQILFDKEGGLCNTTGTIGSTDVGTIVGNIVEGLTADGTTEVTIAWEASLDGITTGDNPKIAIRVFI